jgi:hypothetical protein
MPKIVVACNGCGTELERWPSHVLEQVYCKDCRGASGRGGANHDEIAERRRLVVKLHGDGLDSRAIGQRVGVEHTTVLRDLHAMGCSAEAEREERRRRVAELYPRRRLAEIADELACDPGTVWNDLVAMGIDRERIGRRAIYEQVGERICARDGCERIFTPVAAHAARGWGRFCTPRCSMLHAWATGAPRCQTWLRRTPVAGRARQQWFGRWAGKYGHLGGRPRVALTEAQRAEIAQLDAQGWGRRAIANRLLVSEWAVRNALES